MKSDTANKTVPLVLFIFQECPGGIVQEDLFKEIYAKFFPHGSEYFSLGLDANMPTDLTCSRNSPATNLRRHFIADAHTYAHHVFQAFDINRNGSISFRVSKLKLGIN